MREAVIVSTARTAIGKAYRGAFNDTPAPTLGGHVIAHAVSRAGLDPAEVDDVVVGCGLPHGTAFWNIARVPSDVRTTAAERRTGAVTRALSVRPLRTT